jgi:hypothetical protein
VRFKWLGRSKTAHQFPIAVLSQERLRFDPNVGMDAMDDRCFV